MQIGASYTPPPPTSDAETAALRCDFQALGFRIEAARLRGKTEEEARLRGQSETIAKLIDSKTAKSSST